MQETLNKRLRLISDALRSKNGVIAQMQPGYKKSRPREKGLDKPSYVAQSPHKLFKNNTAERIVCWELRRQAKPFDGSLVCLP
jgi:hypothetical protein